MQPGTTRIVQNSLEPLLTKSRIAGLLPKRLRVPVRHAGLVVTNEVFSGSPLPPGVHWVWAIPFLETVQTYVVDLRTRTDKFRFQKDLFTRDEQMVAAELAITYHIADPVQFALEMTNPEDTLLAKVKAIIGAALRGMESLEIFIAGQSLLQGRILADVRQCGSAVGFDIEGCDITEISLPDEIRSAYARAIEKSREAKVEVERLKELLLSGTSDLMLKEKVASSMMRTGLLPGSFAQFYARDLGAFSAPPPSIPSPALTSRPDASPLMQATVIAKAPPPPPPLEVLQTSIRQTPTPHLRAIQGELSGSAFPFVLPLTRIGRAPDNQICLPPSDLAASRYHAALRRAPDGSFWLKNTSSVNEVLVNGQQLLPQTEVQITPGNTISISDSIFEFILPGGNSK